MFNVLVCMRRCEVSPISFKSNCFVINAACEWKGLQIHPECNNLRAVWALVGLSSLTAFVAALCALSFACKNPSQRIAVVSCICSAMAAIFGLGAVGVWAGTDLHRIGYSFGIGKRSAPHWCFVFVVVSFLVMLLCLYPFVLRNRFHSGDGRWCHTVYLYGSDVRYW